MDFFYRERPWYAGQFIRKIIPQFSLTKESIPFFTTLLNNQKGKLLSVLVRHIDETFLNSKVSMPFSKEGKIDFDFINSFMKQLEIERLEVLKSYLTASGAPDFCLTKEETLAITSLKTKEFKNFKVTDIFSQKIKHDFVTLPLNNGQPDFETLGHLTSALKKLVLKSVNDFVTEKTSKLITQ